MHLTDRNMLIFKTSQCRSCKVT